MFAQSQQLTGARSPRELGMTPINTPQDYNDLLERRRASGHKIGKATPFKLDDPAVQFSASARNKLRKAGWDI